MASFYYKNPIREGITGGIRDSQIIEEEGRYYLIGTCAPFWYWEEEKNPGIKIYSSHDLLNWKFEKLLIDRNRLDPSVWYLDRFWAPEIHEIQGKYYLTYNCQNETTEEHLSRGQQSGVAVSETLLGDYTVLTHDAPLLRGNDLTLFEDADGQVYAFNNRDKTVFVTPIDVKRMKPLAESEPCITAGNLGQGDWDGVSIEGAYCLKREGVFYLFYSSWSRGYEIGYATASHPLGRWTKSPRNPIYGGQNRESCKKYGIAYSGDPENPWAAVGHNAVFTGPDGRLWICCHGILKGEATPYLVIDPIEFVDGEIHIEGPTHNEQNVEWNSK
jgi:xylan 1,4-beta-xylosidase